jgi:hypothetical protein
LAEADRTKGSGSRVGGLPAELSELWDLVVAYAKQQTVDPFKALGRYVAWGVAGAASLSLGFLLLALGGLRAIQFETIPHLTGNLSWIPYLIVVAMCALVVAVAVSRMMKAESGGEQ